MVGADEAHDVVDVVDYASQGGMLPVDEGGGEVHTHHPSPVREGPDHLVCEVPGMVADGPAVGVGGDHRSPRQVHEVPESGVAEVGDVDDDP